MTSRAVPGILAFALLVGCAAEQAAPPAVPAAPAAPVASASAAAPIAAPGPGDWDQWSHAKKLDYMKASVMPKMGAAFHDFDATKYASPKCSLCHAAGAKDGTFKMPDAALPKLPANPAEFKTLVAKDPKIFDFMVKTVVPQTAALLGEQPYDPATKQGFGCYNCHTKAS